jgi:hypothetical protein
VPFVQRERATLKWRTPASPRSRQMLSGWYGLGVLLGFVAQELQRRPSESRRPEHVSARDHRMIRVRPTLPSWLHAACAPHTRLCDAQALAKWALAGGSSFANPDAACHLTMSYGVL